MLLLRNNGETNDMFPDENLFCASHNLILWFSDFANYLSSDMVPLDLSSYQRNKFMHDVKKFFLDEPYLYRSSADGIIRVCVTRDV